MTDWLLFGVMYERVLIVVLTWLARGRRRPVPLAQRAPVSPAGGANRR